MEGVVRVCAALLFSANDVFVLWYIPPDIVKLARHLGIDMEVSGGSLWAFASYWSSCMWLGPLNFHRSRISGMNVRINRFIITHDLWIKVPTSCFTISVNVERSTNIAPPIVTVPLVWSRWHLVRVCSWRRWYQTHSLRWVTWLQLVCTDHRLAFANDSSPESLVWYGR